MKLKFPKFFYILLGLFLGLVIYGAQAAWNTPVSSGQLLKAEDYQGLINKVTELNNKKVAFASGTVVHGGTVPVPGGYTRTDCHTIVSFSEGVTSTPTAPTTLGMYASVNASGVVKCRVQQDDGHTLPDATCNYLIVCSK